MTRRLWLWLPPLVYMAAIFAFSAEQDPLPPITHTVWDKLLHVVEYGLLAVLLSRAFLGERLSTREALVWGLLAASVYAATDELHQWLVPGRFADVRDWMADTVGAAAGAAAYVWGVSDVFRPRKTWRGYS